MQYVGIQTQQSRNNFRSLLLLCLFPCLVMGLLFAFCYLLHLLAMNDDGLTGAELLGYSTGMFIHLAPYVLGGVLIWFIIAYFANTSIINSATGSEPLSRMENKRVYNLVENLCMSQGMKMPNINIINDDSLNAFASGINERTYTVSLSRGIIDKLDDQELEAVIAHELSHIRNKDVRLMIVSIVFVGIFAMLAQMAMRSVYYSSMGHRRDEKNNTAIIIFLVMVVAAIGYFFSMLMRFAISRKREYLADASCRNDQESARPRQRTTENIGRSRHRSRQREDVAQLFIQHPGQQAKSALNGLSGLFATHPPIESGYKYSNNSNLIKI